MKLIRPTEITDGGGSFTRASTATYFDSSGILQSAAINVPRIGYFYNGDGWRLLGPIIEPARTNLLFNSAFPSFSAGSANNVWLEVLAEVDTTVNAAVAPDGTTTAALVAVNTTASFRFISQRTGATTANTYSFSVYVKPASTDNVVTLLLAGDVSAANGVRVNFTVTASGTIAGSTVLGTATAGTHSIQSVGNGWYRCTVVAVLTATTPTNVTGIIYPGNQGAQTANSQVYLWGAQLEVGAFPTSYIPTTTATVTRAADTCTGTGYIYSNVPETDYAAWVSGTTYTLGQRVIRTTATTHAIYERVVAGAGTTAPESDVNNWLYFGPTNRWAAFDDSPSTITSNSDSITYILKPGRINSVALLELEATEVAVNITVNGETQFYGYTDLLSNNNVGNWYEYFYEPFYYQTSLALTDLVNAAILDLPQYADAVLSITIRKPAGTPKVGVIACGVVFELGKTQNGMNVGINDYSRKDTDSFGNTILVRRKYSKRVKASFFLYSSKVDVVSNLLTQYRATPVVWIAADAQYSALVVYGFYRDWDIGIPNNIGSLCNIEIEGLT